MAQVKIDISAQIMGYQDSIKQLKAALANIDAGSNIGKSISAAIASAEKDLKKLEQHPVQFASSDAQIERIVSNVDNLGDRIQNVGRMFSQVQFSDLRIDEVTQKIEELRNQALKLQQDMSNAMSDAVKNAAQSGGHFAQVVKSLNIDPKDMTGAQIYDALAQSAQEATKKVEELQKAQEQIIAKKTQATDKKAAAEQFGLLDPAARMKANDQLALALQQAKAVDPAAILMKVAETSYRGAKNGGSLAKKAVDAVLPGLTPENLRERIEQIVQQAFGEEGTFMTKASSRHGPSHKATNWNSALMNMVLPQLYGNMPFDFSKKSEKEFVAGAAQSWQGQQSQLAQMYNSYKPLLDQFGGDTKALASLSNLIGDGTVPIDPRNLVQAYTLLIQTVNKAIENMIAQHQAATKELEQINTQEQQNAANLTEAEKTAMRQHAAVVHANNLRQGAAAPVQQQLEENAQQQTIVKRRAVNRAQNFNGTNGNFFVATNELKLGAQAAQQYQQQLTNAQKAEQMMGKVQGVVQRWFSIYTVVRAVGNAIRTVISTISDLDKTITEIAIVTNIGHDSLWGQMDQYVDMAQKYATSIAGVYKVSQLYYQQGLQQKDVMALTEQTLKMARISGLDYATATDYMTNAIRSFKMEMQDAQTVVDVYSALAASAATSVTELATAMSKTASSAQAVGSSFENTAAMMTVMIEATREAPENIGSAMKSIISRYGELKTDPGKMVDAEGEELSLNKVDTALQSVGISLHDAQGQFRDFDDVIGDLSDKWDTLDKNTQRYIATVMAGNRQQSRFLALVSSGERYRGLQKIAEDSEDAAQLQELSALEGIEAKKQRQQNALQSLYVDSGLEKAYKTWLDLGTRVITTYTDMNKMFNMPIPAIAKFAGQFTTLATIITNAFAMLKVKFTALMTEFSAKIKIARNEPLTAAEQAAALHLNLIRKTNQAEIEATRRTEEEKSKIRTAGENKRRRPVLPSSYEPAQETGPKAWFNKHRTGAGMVLSMAGLGVSTYADQLNVNEQRRKKSILTGTGSLLQGAGMLALYGASGPIGWMMAALTALPGIIQSIGMWTESSEERAKRLKEAAEEANNKALQKKSEYKTFAEDVKELKRLKKAQHESTEEREKYLELNAKMAEEHPELIDYYDEEGNAIINLTTAYDALAASRLAAAEAAEEGAKRSAEEAENTYKDSVTKINNQQQSDLKEFSYKQAQIFGRDADIGTQLGIFAEDQVRSKLYTSTAKPMFSSDNGVTSLDIGTFIAGLGYTDEIIEKWQQDLIDNASGTGDSLTKFGMILGSVGSELQKLSTNDDWIKFYTNEQNGLPSLITGLEELVSTTTDQELLQGYKAYLYIAKYLNESFSASSGGIRNAGKVLQLSERTNLVNEVNTRNQLLRYSTSDGQLLGNTLLDEMPNVSNIITDTILKNYFSWKNANANNAIPSQYKSRYEWYQSTVLDGFYENTIENLEAAWKAVGEAGKQSEYEEAIKNVKNYSETQFTTMLGEMGINNSNVIAQIIGAYFPETRFTEQRLQAFITNRDENKVFADQLEAVYGKNGTLTGKLGEAELESVKNFYTFLLNKIDNNELTNINALNLGELYNNLFQFAVSAQDEVAQAILASWDDYSIAGIIALQKQLKDTSLKDMDFSNFISNLPVNLNAEINSYFTNIKNKVDDYTKALSQATGGMELDDAMTMAQKLNKSITDFNFRSGKFYLQEEDFALIASEYLESDNELFGQISKKIDQRIKLLEKKQKTATDNKQAEEYGKEIESLRLQQSEWENASKDYIAYTSASPLFKQGKITSAFNILKSQYGQAYNWDALQEQFIQGNVENLSGVLLDLYNEYRDFLAGQTSSKIFSDITGAMKNRSRITLTGLKIANKSIYDQLATQDGLEKYITQSGEDLIVDFSTATKEQLISVYGLIDQIMSSSITDSDSLIQLKAEMHDFIYEHNTYDIYKNVLDNYESFDELTRQYFTSHLDQTADLNQYIQQLDNGKYRLTLAGLKSLTFDDISDKQLRSELEASRAKAIEGYSVRNLMTDVIKNRTALTNENIVSLGKILNQSYDEVTAILQRNADGTYTASLSQIKSWMEKKGIQTNTALLTLVDEQFDAIISEITGLAGNQTKGYTNLADMRKYANRVANSAIQLGEKDNNPETIFEDLFTWNDSLHAYVMTAKGMSTQMILAADTLAEYGTDTDEYQAALKMMQDIPRQMAANIDFEGFMESAERFDKNSQVYISLKDSLEQYYEFMGESTKSVDATIASLQKGGIEGLKAAQDLAAAQGKHLSEEQRTKILQMGVTNIMEAVDALDNLVVGAMVPDNVAKQIENRGISITKVGDFNFIKSIDNLAEAYNGLIDDLKKQGLATIEQINNIRVKQLHAKYKTDSIEALNKAAEMTFDDLGTIFTDLGIELTENFAEQFKGIFEIVDGKVRVTDFEAYAKMLKLEPGSRAYTKALSSYNDAMIALDTELSDSIQSEFDNLAKVKLTAGKNVRVNLTNFYSSLAKQSVESYYDQGRLQSRYAGPRDWSRVDNLNQILKQYGAYLENGILTLNARANLPAIAKEIASFAKENHLELDDQMNGLLDAVNELVKSLGENIKKGIEGTLTRVEAADLKTNAKNILGIDIDFSQTADGLKIANQQAIELYYALKQVDAAAAGIVFDGLKDSLTKVGEDCENISRTMAEIAKLQRNPSIDNKDLQQRLALYQEIARTQMADASQYDFMGRGLPDIYKGPLNYWNSIGKMFTAMNQAGKAKHNLMGVEDFYNIVNELNNMAAISGNKVKFLGYELGGDLEDASRVIQAGFGALENIDGKGAMINLGSIAVNMSASASNMQVDIEQAIDGVADSQIQMLDGLIALLETIVAMEDLANITGSDISLDLPEIFIDGSSISKDATAKSQVKYQQAYMNWAKALIDQADADKKLGDALKSVIIGDYSLYELVNDATDGNYGLKISVENYQKIMDSFQKMARSGEWDANDPYNSLLTMIKNSQIDEAIVIGTGNKNQKVVVQGGYELTSNENGEFIVGGQTFTDPQKAIDAHKFRLSNELDTITRQGEGAKGWKGEATKSVKLGNIMVPVWYEVDLTADKPKVTVSSVKGGKSSTGENLPSTLNDYFTEVVKPDLVKQLRDQFEKKGKKVTDTQLEEMAEGYRKTFIYRGNIEAVVDSEITISEDSEFKIATASVSTIQSIVQRLLTSDFSKETFDLLAEIGITPKVEVDGTLSNATVNQILGMLGVDTTQKQIIVGIGEDSVGAYVKELLDSNAPIPKTIVVDIKTGQVEPLAEAALKAGSTGGTGGSKNNAAPQKPVPGDHGHPYSQYGYWDPSSPYEQYDISKNITWDPYEKYKAKTLMAQAQVEAGAEAATNAAAEIKAATKRLALENRRAAISSLMEEENKYSESYAKTAAAVAAAERLKSSLVRQQMEDEENAAIKVAQEADANALAAIIRDKAAKAAEDKNTEASLAAALSEGLVSVGGAANPSGQREKVQPQLADFENRIAKLSAEAEVSGWTSELGTQLNNIVIDLQNAINPERDIDTTLIERYQALLQQISSLTDEREQQYAAKNKPQESLHPDTEFIKAYNEFLALGGDQSDFIESFQNRAEGTTALSLLLELSENLREVTSELEDSSSEQSESEPEPPKYGAAEMGAANGQAQAGLALGLKNAELYKKDKEALSARLEANSHSQEAIIQEDEELSAILQQQVDEKEAAIQEDKELSAILQQQVDEKEAVGQQQLTDAFNQFFSLGGTIEDLQIAIDKNSSDTSLYDILTGEIVGLLQMQKNQPESQKEDTQVTDEVNIEADDVVIENPATTEEPEKKQYGIGDITEDNASAVYNALLDQAVNVGRVGAEHANNLKAYQYTDFSEQLNDIQVLRSSLNLDDSQFSQVIENAINSLDQLPDNTSVNISAPGAQQAANEVNQLKNNIRSLSGKSVTVDANINANISGAGSSAASSIAGALAGIITSGANAAKGNVALATGQKQTLMGELGPELVVSNGRYFVVGQNGAEFVNLNPDAIVFNHLQTKKLLSGANGGHGTPVTNERVATSFATGNASGPAMASARAALAALRQIRAMWQRMKDASLKDLGQQAGGGGGGGGGDKNKIDPGYIADLERWYNLLRQIDNLERDINYEEKLRTKLQEDLVRNGTAVYQSQKRSLDMLQQQIEKHEHLSSLQKSYYEARRKDLATTNYGKIFTFDENGLMQYNDNATMKNGDKGGLFALAKINAQNPDGSTVYTAREQYELLKSWGFGEDMKYTSEGKEIEWTDDKGKAREEAYTESVQAFWDHLDGWKEELDGLYDSYNDSLNNLLDAEAARNEILKAMQENQLSLEQKILKAIENREQQIIDKLEEEKDALEDASKDYIDGLNKQMEKEQNMYERQQASEDMNKIRRQLAILQRSGGSASQIKSLENQLKTQEQDAYFQAQQDQINAIQEASDKEIERLDAQLEVMKESLEYQKENGLFWPEVTQIMQGSSDEIIAFLKTYSPDIEGLSALDLETQLQEIGDSVDQWTARRDDEAHPLESDRADEAGTGWKAWGVENKEFYKPVWDAKVVEAEKAYRDAYAVNSDSVEATTAARKVFDDAMEEYYRKHPELDHRNDKVTIKNESSGSGGTGGTGNGSSGTSNKTAYVATFGNDTKYFATKKEAEEWLALEQKKNWAALGDGSISADELAAYNSTSVALNTSIKSTVDKFKESKCVNIGDRQKHERIDYYTYTTRKTMENHTLKKTVNKDKSITYKCPKCGMQWTEYTQEQKNEIKKTTDAAKAAGDISLSEANLIKLNLKEYATGGTVDYTGLAMLHGSKTNPETVLSAAETKMWKDDILSGKRGSLTNSLVNFSNMVHDMTAVGAEGTAKSGDTINIDNAVVNMNATIANDYDARRAGQNALEEMVKIARKSGTQSIRR